VLGLDATFNANLAINGTSPARFSIAGQLNLGAGGLEIDSGPCDRGASDHDSRRDGGFVRRRFRDRDRQAVPLLTRAGRSMLRHPTSGARAYSPRPTAARFSWTLVTAAP